MVDFKPGCPSVMELAECNSRLRAWFAAIIVAIPLGIMRDATSTTTSMYQCLAAATDISAHSS